MSKFYINDKPLTRKELVLVARYCLPYVSWAFINKCNYGKLAVLVYDSIVQRPRVMRRFIGPKTMTISYKGNYFKVEFL